MVTQVQKKFKVLLIGDICVDEYHYGTVDRISPEAPVPIFKFNYKETKPGMAANVRANLETLNVNVVSISAEHSTKTRLIDLKSKQQIVRIDNDVIIQTPLQFQVLSPSIFEVDAIVVSDYNKGLVSYELIEKLRQTFKGPIFIDTKKPDLIRFRGCFVKINESEYNQRKTINDTLIVTLGNKGAILKQNLTEKNFPSSKVEVTDVCGAGDTFLAALVYKFLLTNNIDQSIIFANRAAAVTVQHVGVYSPKLEEILCQD